MKAGRILRVVVCAGGALVAFAACSTPTRDSGRTSRRSAPDASTLPETKTPASSAPAQPETKPTASSAPAERVCLPVAACNMFTECALAEAQVEASGTVKYRVLQYDHHPNRVGDTWARRKVCWPEQADKTPPGCADALDYPAACTATPNEQMALRYRCGDKDGKCSKLPI